MRNAIDSPFLNAESPFVNAESPFVNAESPFVSAESSAPDDASAEAAPDDGSEESAPDLRENLYEVFDEVRELWDAGEAGELESLRGEESDAAFEAESDIEEREKNFDCTESGYGIIGDTDDRRRVNNTLEIPCRWICHLKVRRRDSNGVVTDTGGTGVLISPRHVLTVAHLVSEAKRDNRNQWVTYEATQIWVMPARDDDDRPLDTHDVDLPAQVARGWNPKGKPASFDYALLTLKKSIGDETFKRLGGAKLCYWGSKKCGGGTTVRVVPGDRLDGRTAFTAGYPKDLGGGTIPYITTGQISIASPNDRTMDITADACQGQSGSPVWVKNGKERCMVGLMVSVGATANTALHFTDGFCQDIATWMKGASDVCAGAAGTSGTAKSQSELESGHTGGCRCQRGAQGEAVGVGDFEREHADDHESLLGDGRPENELIAAVAYQADEDVETEGGEVDDLEVDDESGDDEYAFEARPFDPAVSDLAERAMAREEPFEGDTPARWTRCFSAADVANVKSAYEENTTAAASNDGDRCSCIVMLNTALGKLLPLTLKQNRARGTSSRRVQMAALTTETIEKAMRQLRRKGFATKPTELDFLDKRNRRAGTLKPEKLKESVQDTVLALSKTTESCWFAYGLSIMDGYHSVALLVDRTAGAGRIYWLDQFSTGIDDDVTTTLDQRITDRTQTWWQSVKASKGVGYDTTIRLWPLRKKE